ncbi:MAG: hypothetical protein U0350_13660 [Caldilineaceae bacterium]
MSTQRLGSAMQLFFTFLPHVIGLAGALFLVVALWHVKPWLLLISLMLYGLLFVGLVGFTPDRWLRAVATPETAFTHIPRPTTAVIMGFGYDMVGDQMQPGPANQFLLDWVLKNQPQITTLFVQEGVLVAMSPALLREKTVRRIHRHDPALYVDTLDTAFCAMRQLQRRQEQSVLLVSHDMQLQRAVWDFERVQRQMCSTCTLVIPELPTTPYPPQSVHLQTRNAFIYKVLELLYLRPRDLLRSLPATCKAPIEE